jgi:hypothetical protein
MMNRTGGISNIYTTDSKLTVTAAGIGKVNIVSKDPAVKLTNIAIHGIMASSPSWPADTALSTATGYGGTKLVLAKGASSMQTMTPSSFKYNVGGTVVAGANLSIKGLFGTAVWGRTNPDSTGAPAPAGATGGTGNVNTRIRFTLA